MITYDILCKSDSEIEEEISAIKVYWQGSTTSCYIKIPLNFFLTKKLLSIFQKQLFHYDTFVAALKVFGCFYFFFWDDLCIIYWITV